MIPDRPCQTPAVESKRWWDEPRWKNKPPPPPDQWSRQRTRAAADRRHGLVVGCDASNIERHGIALAQCVTGGDIVAGFRSNDFFAFPLEQRRGAVQIPTNAKWHLRGKRVELLGVIAAAMIGMPVAGKPSHGLVATLDELGAVLGLGRTQVSDHLHALQAYGLVHAIAVYAPFGRVHVQRANCYRLTKLAAFAYRLVVRVELPDPVLVAPRRKRVRVAQAYAPGTGTGAGYGGHGSRAHELPPGNPDANPETPVPGDSSGDRVALPGVESPATPATVFPTQSAVPAATSVPPTLPGPAVPVAPGFRGPVCANAAPDVGDVLDDVRRGDVDYSRDPKLRSRRLNKRAVIEDRRRRALLEAQVADGKRRERERAVARAVDAAPAVLPATSPIAELTEDERRELAALNEARRRRAQDREYADDVAFADNVMAGLLRRFGLNPDAGSFGVALDTWRKKS